MRWLSNSHHQTFCMDTFDENSNNNNNNDNISTSTRNFISSFVCWIVYILHNDSYTVFAHSDCRFEIKYPNCRIGLDNFVSLSQSDGNWFWFYFRSDVTMHYTIYCSQCLSTRCIYGNAFKLFVVIFEMAETRDSTSQHISVTIQITHILH